MIIDINDLRAIISEETGMPLDKIHPDSKLISELGVDGDDGYELIESLSNKYNVDLRDIDFDQYFGDATSSPLLIAIRLLLLLLEFLKIIPKGKYPDLSVNDLRQILSTAPSRGVDNS